MPLIKQFNRLKSTTYATATTILMLTACEDGLKKDQQAVCTIAAREGVTSEKLLQDFYPSSPEGKALKQELQTADASGTTIVSELQAKLSREGSPFTCPALETLSVRIEREAKLTAALSTCQEMKGSIDEFAMVLLPLFEAEIPKLIEETVPQEKREDMTRIFNQELRVKRRMLELQGDNDYEKLKQRILKMAGCPQDSRARTDDAPSDSSDGASQGEMSFPPDHEACAEIQQTLPGLTRNRRVVLIGEAYGEALTQSGLDPSQYSEALQNRLLTLAKQDAIRALEPHVKKLGEQTRCHFR